MRQQCDALRTISSLKTILTNKLQIFFRAVFEFVEQQLLKIVHDFYQHVYSNENIIVSFLTIEKRQTGLNSFQQHCRYACNNFNSFGFSSDFIKAQKVLKLVRNAPLLSLDSFSYQHLSIEVTSNALCKFNCYE